MCLGNFNNLCIADGLNVFLIENTSQIKGEAEIRGNKCWVNVNNLDASVPVIIHEIGHCFGLFHTSDRPETFATNVNNMTKTWQCDEQGNLGPVYFHESFTDCEGVSLTFLWEIENVNGENSHVSGDYVRDTPSDINISSGCVPDPYQNCTTVSNACSNKLNPKSRRDPNCQILKPDWFNFMRRTIKPECLDHFTVGQVSRMHGVIYQYLSHLLLNEIPDYFTPCTHCFAGDDNPCYICTEIPTQDIIINQNTIFQQNQIHGTLVIKAGSVLIINNEIELTPYSQIIIEVGGKLIIDGGKLTKCSGVNKWKGIKAWGNPLFGQSHAVELKNGAVIEYAETGINTSNPVYGGIFGYFDLSGAKITVENSTIRNCDVGINFGPFGYSAEFFSWEDGSYIKNSTFSNCLTGVKLSSNLGVEFSDTDFMGNSTYEGIAAINSKVEVSNCSFEGRTGILLMATWPSLSGSLIENNFFYSDDGILIESHENAEPHSIRRNYFNGANGIVATGQSWFSIHNNDFIGNLVGTSNFYTGDDFNIIKGNYFVGDKYGNSVYGMNSTEYLNNCFTLSEQADIELYHESSIFISQGTAELAAGNCFTKNGVPQILTGDNTTSFDYFLKSNTIPQSCKHPGFGNFNIKPSQFEENLECGTGFEVNIPINYRLCIIPSSLNEKRIKEVALRAEILRIKNIPNISPRLKQLLIADYERCLKKLVNMHGIQIIKEEQDGREKAIEYFSEQPLFSHRIMAYTLMMESSETQRAKTYLNSLNVEGNAQADFVQVQNIYHDYLDNPEMYSLSQATKESIRNMAMSKNELSGYIRAMYYKMTGERIRIEIEHVTPLTPRIKSTENDNPESKINAYPNPSSTDEYFIHIPAEWGEVKYRIYIRNISGSLISNSAVYPGENTVDLKGLSSGIYIIEIYASENRLLTSRLVRI